MKQKKELLTPEGLQELKRELEERKTIKREELKNIVEEMRSRGDLSENDGYSLALAEVDSNEQRIVELEDIIENAKVVTSCKDGVVCVGSCVTVKNGVVVKFNIVGEDMANPMENMISYKSPLGAALMDKKIGETAKVETPTGTTTYEIINIE